MRKNFIIIGSLLGCMGCAGGKGDKAEAPARPNIVVILADDLGFGDVSAYGSTTINTPNIDSLARSGVCFSNGYASSATSTPSRYALLTGMYPWKNKDAKILDGDAPLIINHEGFTMPKMLRDNGYATGAVGKWHLGMGTGNVNWNERIAPGAPEVGFDYSCIAAATNDRVPTVFVENGMVMNLDPDDPIYVDYNKGFEGEPNAIDNPELVRMQWSHGHNNAVINGIPRIGYMKGGQKARWIDEDLADFYLSKAKEFVSENADRPFFLYYGLHQPHVPRTPHQRFVGSTTMGPRGDAIIEADWCVGQLMACLDSLGLLENTLVIFTSDDGPVLDDGYKDMAPELVGEHKPAGGLRGGKYSLYDGGTHVPLFAYWKGVTSQKQSDALITHMDIIPSVAKLIGIQVPEGLDAEEHLDALLGHSDKGRDNLVFEADGRIGLRSGNYILIPPYKGKKYNITGNELGNEDTYGLYDVAQDPAQTHNMADENPDLLETLKQKLADLTTEVNTQKQ